MRSLFRGNAKRSSQRERTSVLDNLDLDASWFVERDAINMGVQLGSGGFGTVHLATVTDWPSSEVVVKRVLPQKLKPADAALLRNEITIWALLTHRKSGELSNCGETVLT